MTGPELAHELKPLKIPVLLVSKYPRDVIRSVRGFAFDLDILEAPVPSEELIQRAKKAILKPL